MHIPMVIMRYSFKVFIIPLFCGFNFVVEVVIGYVVVISLFTACEINIFFEKSWYRVGVFAYLHKIFVGRSTEKIIGFGLFVAFSARENTYWRIV